VTGVQTGAVPMWEGGEAWGSRRAV
jgi:hypothetical protein